MNRKLTQIVIMGICCMLFLGACSSLSPECREKLSFNEGWLFSLTDDSRAARPEFVDSAWRKLNLPHDWAIEGDFSQDNPSGTGGGALPGGVGWYRKTFVAENKDKGKHFRIEFDGVYMNSEVFINGTSLGNVPTDIFRLVMI